MNVASLPVILYVLPVFMLLAAFSHPHWKRDALALGGLCLVYVTGGYAALILLALSVSLTWLTLRLSPRRSERHPHRTEIWLYAGIGLQVLLLLLARLLLGSQAVLPMLLCTLQGTECLSSHAAHKLKTPPLHSFFCYQCDMTRLPGGPVLSFPQYEQALAARAVSRQKIGSGASLCIRGLFQLICLSLPLRTVHAQIASGGYVQTALDAAAMMLTFYLMLLYQLKGLAQIGQGLGRMLGYDLPDSFDTPVMADSMQDFWARFLIPMQQWTKRVLLLEDRTFDAAGYFARTALLFGGIGLLFGRGGCGMIWGVCTAVFLTAERYRRQKRRFGQLPVTARRILTAAAVLLGMGTLGSDSLIDAFSCYRALLCINGIPLSDRIGYTLGTNWVPLCIAIAGLFPLRKLLPEENAWGRRLCAVCQPAAELVMLLFSYAELLSRYLRP